MKIRSMLNFEMLRYIICFYNTCPYIPVFMSIVLVWVTFPLHYCNDDRFSIIENQRQQGTYISNYCRHNHYLLPVSMLEHIYRCNIIRLLSHQLTNVIPRLMRSYSNRLRPINDGAFEILIRIIISIIVCIGCCPEHPSALRAFIECNIISNT
jgi:hypothetical protein